jgi:hypothetical protein
MLKSIQSIRLDEVDFTDLKHGHFGVAPRC